MKYGKAVLIFACIGLFALSVMGNIMAGIFLVSLLLAICAGGGFDVEEAPADAKSAAGRVHEGECADCDNPREGADLDIEDEVLGPQDYSKY